MPAEGMGPAINKAKQILQHNIVERNMMAFKGGLNDALIKRRAYLVMWIPRGMTKKA